MAFGLLAACASPSRAQRGPVYCNLTAIEGEQLSNGVRVTLATDGEIGGWGIGWGGSEHQIGRVTVYLGDAKSQLGAAFVPIAKYPVSHAVISPAEWGEEGVGLEVEIFAYLPQYSPLGERYDFYFDASEDGSSVVLLWTSDRFAAPEPPGTPSDLPCELDIASRDGRLTIRAVNARLRDVMGAMSREIGFPIVAAGDTDTRVSLCLDDIPVADAIDLIATGCGLSAGELVNGERLVAESTTRGAYSIACTRRIPLRHLEAVQALDLLPSFLLDYIHADREGNAIIVTGPRSMADRVERDLAKLDSRPPEVVLDVAAVEYASTEGLVRALSLARFADDLAAAVDVLTGDVHFVLLDGLPRGWQALLDSLEAASAGSLRSRASIRTVNGRWGVLFAGQERNIIIERFDPETPAEVLPVEIGTRLSALPRVSTGDELLLTLVLEVSSLRSLDPTTGLPTVARRSSRANIRVRAGDTVAIAGLEDDQQLGETREIPVLADVPLAGDLFRAPARSPSATHLAVFVTPRVVRRCMTDTTGEPHHG
jgi:type II secretory pathway component GspD/PulD (secretin)